MRAVAAGRVAFSDRYGSYGRLVILDHGDGYYTVYGGLGSVEVRVGDDLSRNARLGSIGTDFTPSALFFEVRKGTRTLEPRAWLGSRPTSPGLHCGVLNPQRPQCVQHAA